MILSAQYTAPFKLLVLLLGDMGGNVKTRRFKCQAISVKQIIRWTPAIDAWEWAKRSDQGLCHTSF